MQWFSLFVKLSVNISDIAIIIAKNVDYRCIVHNISKSETISLLTNYILEDRGYILKNVVLNIVSSLLVQNQEMCDKVVNTHSPAIQFVPEGYKIQKMCDNTFNKCFLAFFYS